MKPMRKANLGHIFAISIAALGCTSERAAHVDLRNEPVVRKGTFVDRMVLTGEVDAEVAEPIVIPPLPEWRTTIQWIEQDGARVSKGARLVELDTSTFASQLDEIERTELEKGEQLLQKTEEARAEIADKELDYLKKKADLDKAQLEADIPPEIISVKEYDERQLALDRARTEFEKAKTLLDATRHAQRTEIDNIRLELAEARRQVGIAHQAVETMTLTAPADGLFVINNHPWHGKKIEVGDMAWVGFVIARIPDLATLEIHARLADVDDRKVVQGMPALVTLDAWPDRRMPGRISRVSPVAEEEGGTSLRRFFQVVVTLDEELPEGIRPGLSARVDVETARIENTLIVPRYALDFSGDTPAVRLTDGTSEPTSVVACNATECAIEGSLEEGTRVAMAQSLIEETGS